MDFVVDIETLATEANAVILSAGIIAVDFGKELTVPGLLKDSVYVKFNAKSQIPKRLVEESTLTWWKAQDKEVYDSQVRSQPDDLTLEDGFFKLKSFLQKNGLTKKSIIWTRGELDSTVLQNIAKQLEQPLLFPFYRVRDIRTAVDILYGSDNGYCKMSVDIPVNIKKHHPVYDCIIDALMLRYGIEE